MHWVVQDNLYNESGYVRFLDALDRLEQEYTIVKVVPFSGELIPDVELDGPIMVMGSHSLVKAARRKGWYPGAYTSDNFDYRIWRERLGDNLLNYDANVTRFGDVECPEDVHFFIRPIHDFKEFSGMVITPENFKAWQEKAVAYGDTLNGDTLVAVSPVKKIRREWRFFVVNGNVVAGSLYKIGNMVKSDSNVDPEVYDFANKMANEWPMDLAFVIDIALTDDGYKVIEYNCINSAGFYAADCQKIVSALSAFVGGENCVT